jgi:hypothetical protein
MVEPIAIVANVPATTSLMAAEAAGLCAETVSSTAMKNVMVERTAKLDAFVLPASKLTVTEAAGRCAETALLTTVRIATVERTAPLLVNVLLASSLTATEVAWPLQRAAIASLTVEKSAMVELAASPVSVLQEWLLMEVEVARTVVTVSLTMVKFAMVVRAATAHASVLLK